MNDQDVLKHQSEKESESGQALVIGAAILFCLILTMLLYLSIQRAYNLANFLDETAELAAQSAAEPIADNLVSGQVRIDPASATQKAEATVLFSAQSISGEVDPTTITTTVRTINTIPPAATTEDDICEDYNLNDGDRRCLFPIVVVDLDLPYRLFGFDFVIRSRGVATLGSNSRQPEVGPIVLPTVAPPTPGPVITIDVSGP